ncbi:MAG TPA: RNase adapter RapZ [Acetobacteraceae bacterium]|nr:RNase adapter RapZ [Acetobacteraceae bacterium]
MVLVSGLSGAGKASALRALEDIGYEAVDNPPLPMLEEMVARSERRLAIGVDARTRGFDAGAVLAALRHLQSNPALRAELVFVWADEATLLRRYTETRRRHPLAPQAPVADGIAAEQALTAPLHEAADLALDTSDLPLPALRQRIEQFFGEAGKGGNRRMVVSLVSFAYAYGLPREADLVFDARFLRNPHYDPMLQAKTGLDPDVGAFIAADADYQQFFRTLTDLVSMLLPRFVQEGKKYTTITIGCTGGKHRSVFLVEQLARFLESRIAGRTAGGQDGVEWQLNVTHRELARQGHPADLRNDRSIPRPDGRLSGEAARPSPVQAQEA